MSQYPWHIYVSKTDTLVVLDKTIEEGDTTLSYLDLETVNENASKDMPEEEKEIQKLCMEATNVCKSFKHNVRGKNVHKF